MTSDTSNLISLYNEACKNDPEALRFVYHWCAYVHAIDDIVDGPQSKEQIIAAFVQSNIVFSLPFYRQYYLSLQPVAILAANAYADSVAWESGTKPGQKEMSDVLRFVGNEMLFAVAFICGGYNHLRTISSRVREDSWNKHHDEAKPI